MFNWKSIYNYLDNGTPAPPKKVEKSEEEWKEILTPAQFRVMRMKGTERAHTGELCSFYLITHDPQPASRADMASEGLPRLHAP
ncbi:hypothetical protein ACV1EB_21665, partial [Aeromonas caviae]